MGKYVAGFDDTSYNTCPHKQIFKVPKSKPMAETLFLSCLNLAFGLLPAVICTKFQANLYPFISLYSEAV